jgi:8-oxo-dGTP diphosphatase
MRILTMRPQGFWKSLTGLRGIYLEQLYTYGDPDRDPGGRVISVAYYALIRTDKLEIHWERGYSASWFDFDSRAQTCF